MTRVHSARRSDWGICPRQPPGRSTPGSCSDGYDPASGTASRRGLEDWRRLRGRAVGRSGVGQQLHVAEEPVAAGCYRDPNGPAGGEVRHGRLNQRPLKPCVTSTKRLTISGRVSPGRPWRSGWLWLVITCRSGLWERSAAAAPHDHCVRSDTLTAVRPLYIPMHIDRHQDAEANHHGDHRRAPV